MNRDNYYNMHCMQLLPPSPLLLLLTLLCTYYMLCAFNHNALGQSSVATAAAGVRSSLLQL